MWDFAHKLNIWIIIWYKWKVENKWVIIIIAKINTQYLVNVDIFNVIVVAVSIIDHFE